MGSVDNMSDTWTTEEATEWREFYVPIFTAISLVFCIFAQVLFYIFPRLRIFPRSVLSWLNLYNIYFCVYFLFRWIPNTPWHKVMIAYSPGSTSCRINVFLDVSSITGQYMCGTLLCLSVFLMVVCHIDLEKKRGYFWCFLVSIIVVPILVAIPSMLVSTSAFPGGSCQIGDSLVNKLVRSPYIFMLAFQIILMGWTLRYIRNIFSAVRNYSITTLPIKYIFVRFTITVLAQIYNLLPLQYNLTFPEHTSSHAIYTRFAVGSHTTGPMLDALVMIFGNTEFTNWIFKKISALHISFSRNKPTTEVNTKEPKNREEQERIHEEEREGSSLEGIELESITSSV